MGGVPVDFTTAIMLAQPTGWYYLDDSQTMKVPIYGQDYQVATEEGDIGIELLGNPKTGDHYDLLVGNFTWSILPDDATSRSRIPVFSTGTSTIIDATKVASRMVGMQRTKLLTNPVGFIEINPGQWAPYW
jgi:hypothetical protein